MSRVLSHFCLLLPELLPCSAFYSLLSFAFITFSLLDIDIHGRRIQVICTHVYVCLRLERIEFRLEKTLLSYDFFYCYFCRPALCSFYQLGIISYHDLDLIPGQPFLYYESLLYTHIFTTTRVKVMG